MQQARTFLLEHTLARVSDESYDPHLPAQIAEALEHGARLLHLKP